MMANVPPRGARQRRHVRCLLGLVALLSLAVGSTGQAHTGGSPPVDRAAPWTPKVTALVNALTIDEKISLVHGGTDPAPKGQAGYTASVDRLGIPPRRDTDALGINVSRTPPRGRPGWASARRSTASPPALSGGRRGPRDARWTWTCSTARRSTSPGHPTGVAT